PPRRGNPVSSARTTLPRDLILTERLRHVGARILVTEPPVVVPGADRAGHEQEPCVKLLAGDDLHLAEERGAQTPVLPSVLVALLADRHNPAIHLQLAHHAGPPDPHLVPMGSRRWVPHANEAGYLVRPRVLVRGEDLGASGRGVLLLGQNELVVLEVRRRVERDLPAPDAPAS